METLSFNFDEDPEPEPVPRRTVYTVAELTEGIQSLLSAEFEDVRVSGEISGFKIWSSGHAYFNLRDNSALLKSVVWKSSLRYMKVKPADGMSVVARGSIDVRAERGEYQLIVSSLEAQGEGALLAAFERLKQRLAAKGLFDAARKRSLPPHPRRIGIVTSPKGAVIRDMISVLARRSPGIQVRLYPTPVQGEGAVEGICAGVAYFSQSGWAEVIIAGRGGGSLEDLWAFNEEAVARAIAASAVPVISAVGHETDFTIADFVADLRAPTPSAAAELAVPDQGALLDRLGMLRTRTVRAMEHRLNLMRRRMAERGAERALRLLQSRIGRLQQRIDDREYAIEAALRRRLAGRRAKLDELDRRLRRQDLRLRLAHARQRLLHAEGRLAGLIRQTLSAARERLSPLFARLEALSPLAVLERGYAIVETSGLRVVKDPAQVPAGSRVHVRVAHGRFDARVEAGGEER